MGGFTPTEKNDDMHLKIVGLTVQGKNIRKSSILDILKSCQDMVLGKWTNKVSLWVEWNQTGVSCIFFLLHIYENQDRNYGKFGGFCFLCVCLLVGCSYFENLCLQPLSTSLDPGVEMISWGKEIQHWALFCTAALRKPISVCSWKEAKISPN